MLALIAMALISCRVAHTIRRSGRERRPLVCESLYTPRRWMGLRAGNDVYRLKNQAGIEIYAGEKVRVTGFLDPKTNGIDNTHIEVFPAPPHSAPSKE